MRTSSPRGPGGLQAAIRTMVTEFSSNSSVVCQVGLRSGPMSSGRLRGPGGGQVELTRCPLGWWADPTTLALQHCKANDLFEPGASALGHAHM